MKFGILVLVEAPSLKVAEDVAAEFKAIDDFEQRIDGGEFVDVWTTKVEEI